MKKFMVGILFLATACTLFAAGGKDGKKTTDGMSGTIVFALWDNDAIKLFESMDLEGRFQKLYPNANIEFEKIKDDSEYWNAMKMRAAANQLPDIMYNKTFTLSRFKDYLVDLNGTQAAKNNTAAEGYAIEGKILGIPEKMSGEYVYYWKDMFKEAGVSIPTTWDEFCKAAEKLQAYYGKTNPDFMAIAIGGKDEWPTYPFSEFMPAIQNGNGKNWNTMASQNEPFSADTDFYAAYEKIDRLFKSGAFGRDPLGIGDDQANSLFAQKRAAMFVSGGWALARISEGADGISDLGTFYLPVRDTKADPYRVITQGDSFLGVTSHSKNPELAKAFIEFYFSDAWYPDYINAISEDSTMATVKKAKNPVLAEADSVTPDKVMVMYDGGGDEFTALVAATAFDYKKLASQMLMKNFDTKTALNDLNAKWKAARAKLGMN